MGTSYRAVSKDGEGRREGSSLRNPAAGGVVRGVHVGSALHGAQKSGWARAGGAGSLPKRHPVSRA